jgi:Na+/proline symporter
MAALWTILIWLSWGMMVLGSLFMCLLIVAFADSPGANKAAQRAIGPGMVWVAASIFVGAALLVARETWWLTGLASVLAVSPPVVVLTLTSLFLRLHRK